MSDLTSDHERSYTCIYWFFIQYFILIDLLVCWIDTNVSYLVEVHQGLCMLGFSTNMILKNDLFLILITTRINGTVIMLGCHVLTRVNSQSTTRYLYRLPLQSTCRFPLQITLYILLVLKHVTVNVLSLVCMIFLGEICFFKKLSCIWISIILDAPILLTHMYAWQLAVYLIN